MKNLKNLGRTLNKPEQQQINGGFGGSIGGDGECDHECSVNSDCPAGHPQCIPFKLSTSCPDNPIVRKCV